MESMDLQPMIQSSLELGKEYVKWKVKLVLPTSRVEINEASSRYPVYLPRPHKFFVIVVRP